MTEGNSSCALTIAAVSSTTSDTPVGGTVEEQYLHHFGVAVGGGQSKG
eukprot:CAMPEP_0171644492 /NCGR_PEP_ID=MMETSP0990-20121206/33421_1 /TAXON_ID=483369 /ORGANISM="non described non described, Strain CCMP2098" /LENGTH=47 /DNA_ID= /DNA_START= /DNA_END= /DNA_ORIENTATION=